MHTLVNREGRSLNKLLATIREIADVRSDTAVDTLYEVLGTRTQTTRGALTVSSQVTSSCETFAAGAAGICFHRLRRGRRRQDRRDTTNGRHRRNDWHRRNGIVRHYTIP